MAGDRRNSRSRRRPPRKTSAAEYRRDPDVPDLELRIGSKGHRSWTMLGRFGGARNTTRRVVGNAHKMSVKEARELVLHGRR